MLVGILSEQIEKREKNVNTIDTRYLSLARTHSNSKVSAFVSATIFKQDANASSTTQIRSVDVEAHREDTNTHKKKRYN